MSHDPEDVRLRFGMDPPRLEETRHYEELVSGADEYTFADHVHDTVADQWMRELRGELADDADGEA